MPRNSKVEAKSTSPKNLIQKTDGDKIRALEEQLAQRESEFARLSNENQKLLKETEQRATELQIINNIGQILTEGGDLNSAIKSVGNRLRDTLELKNIAITIADQGMDNVVAQYFSNDNDFFSSEYFALEKFKKGMRLSMRGHGRSWVVNRDAEKSWRKFASTNDFESIPKSFVMFPLLAGHEVIGAITIADYEMENAFTNITVGLLETIASNMGTVIQNVRLFEETQRLLKETKQRATELQIINNIGQTLTEGGELEIIIQRVGERIQEALNINNIAISVLDNGTGHLIAAYMIRNGEPLTFTDENFDLRRYKMMMRASARAGGISWVVKDVDKVWRKSWRGPIADDVPKSMIVLPLLAGGEIIGGISLADYKKEDAFTDLSVNLLETIASNMGTAVQNVRLFDETQRLLKETEQRATELQIINNIGVTLTEGFDLKSTLEHVTERLREVLNLENIAITIADPHKDIIIAQYFHSNYSSFTANLFSFKKYRMGIRMSMKGMGRSWVVDTNVEKSWRKFAADVLNEDDVLPKSFILLPLLAGKDAIGGITIADYEREDAFANISTSMLEIIAANMGTAIQNVRLFDETQRLFTEAEEARASAEQANKAKSTFLANMSHELRTPLNAIMGFTRIVKKKAEGTLPEKQIENLDKVLISSEHLLGLINTVLDIAKIEAGRMDVVPAKFSLNTLADQCGTLAMPLLKSNVTLEKQLDESLGFIFSDQDKIKQIVLNLLSNAAKFTHEGKILLSVQKVSEENVSISVKDSGIGISAEALGRVFEEFQQADNTTTRQYGGTGLGLTISRNLARLLGGDLTAASDGVPGKGSTFTLTLPIQYGKKSASPSDIKPDSVQTAESQADNLSTQQNVNQDSLKTILIVEDTELNINLLTQLLEDDYNLLVAKDGAQGVSMAGQNNPDLILMDISLPIIDGYEATRKIRMTMPSTPIIGLSAHAMSGDAEKAKEAGCNEYMTKPIDEALLIKTLNQYLR